MSSNIHSLVKWMPLKIVEFDSCFDDCRSLQKDCLNLIQTISEKLSVLKNFEHTELNYSVCEKESLDIKDFENIAKIMENINLKFSNSLKSLKIEKEHHAITTKIEIFKNLLWKSKLQLCYIAQDLITRTSCFFVSYGHPWLVLTLRLSVCFNNLLALDSKFNLPKNTNTVCRNTCPYLMFPLKKFSITRLLQILAKNRAEMCSHKLIDCLLDTYKMYETSDEDWSESSSMEIYLSLTKHMSPPIDIESYKQKTKEKTENEDSLGSFTNLEELITYEETNVLNILNVAAQMAPNMLGSDGVKKSKSSGESKVKSEAVEKVLEYYEQSLWAEVGNYLEHVILWWASSPLSARPPHSSQHLREWINQFVPMADIPAVIAAALTSLADALGVHVTSTLWDSCFRQALVSSKNHCNTETGRLFSNVLQELVQLSNLCEVTPDWTVGAPLDELPLVEQIPVLHRLDHSVHTARLWAVNECRKMAHNWNVHGFFSITQVDIVDCLSQLNLLRLNDHTIEIEKGRLAVHVEVCSLMRAKLVSEVRVNILKLKESPKECIECLASICTTISLANLKMIFPPKQFWKTQTPELPEVACGYVEKYLDQILKPVLIATSDPVICNMVLTLICESWLDHIYNNKIKFSQYGACQLLTDFAFVSIWIQDCGIIKEALKKKLLRNEVLKRCEGVGKLLLRNPGEKLKMVEHSYRKKSITENSSGDENESKEHMPAEMYVPNQEQWLELRALRKKFVFNPLCC